MKKQIKNKFLKRILLFLVTFCISWVVFADEATQDTNYYDLKVIVDGINRIEGRLLALAIPPEKYDINGQRYGRGKIDDVDDYTMEFVIDSLKQGEYGIISSVLLEEKIHLYLPRYQYAFSRINDKELDLDIKHGEPQLKWPAFEDIKISIPETKVIRLILSNNKVQ